MPYKEGEGRAAACVNSFAHVCFCFQVYGALGLRQFPVTGPDVPTYLATGDSIRPYVHARVHVRNVRCKMNVRILRSSVQSTTRWILGFSWLTYSRAHECITGLALYILALVRSDREMLETLSRRVEAVSPALVESKMAYVRKRKALFLLCVRRYWLFRESITQEK